jgi:hypothetical protein
MMSAAFSTAPRTPKTAASNSNTKMSTNTTSFYADPDVRPEPSAHGRAARLAPRCALRVRYGASASGRHAKGGAHG